MLFFGLLVAFVGGKIAIRMFDRLYDSIQNVSEQVDELTRQVEVFRDRLERQKWESLRG
jgi:hypothetical protein